MLNVNKNKRKEIIKYFEIKLSDLGFQIKGNALTRETEKGLIQVINFALGQNHSITHNQLGLGFGIYTEEWHHHLGFGAKPKNINGNHCELRDDFNTFIPKNDNSSWIDLNQDEQLIINKCTTIIESYFIPHLEKLTTRKKIIEQWRLYGNNIGLPARGGLSIAILYWYLNEKDRANEIFISELSHHKAKLYYEYVNKIRNELMNKPL